MGVASGCGVKEVYRFYHTTYPYSSCSYLFFFAAASLLFVHFLKCFSFLSQFLIVILCIKYFSRCIDTHTGNYGRSTAAI